MLFECSSHLHGSISSISVREELKGDGATEEAFTEEAFTEEGSSIHSIVLKKQHSVVRV